MKCIGRAKGRPAAVAGAGALPVLRRGVGALLVGHFEAGALVFAGKVGTGFDNARLESLRARLGAIEIAEVPFSAATGLPRLGVHWVLPELVVQVAFMEWTANGKLRHPRFVGVREGKRAHEVTRERGSPTPTSSCSRSPASARASSPPITKRASAPSWLSASPRS